MDYVVRNKSIITGKDNLEQLYTFKDFPVFLGCVDHPENEDLKADMSRSICPESGMIQLNKLIPLEILYAFQHADGIGERWNQYYTAFAEYIKKQGVNKILEIGGGGGKIAENFIKISPESIRYMVEPNPLIESTEKIKIFKAFFDDKFKFTEEIDCITHSVVFEHVYNPKEFLLNIANFLKPGQKQIMGLPDLKLFLADNFTNSINFEHTFLLSEYFTDYLLTNTGFKIIDKIRYEKYNIFYTVEKSDSVMPMQLDSQYAEYKGIFSNFVSYHEKLILDLNKRMNEYNGEIYLFGAHIFSQYLFGFGLDQTKIKGLLDNSSLKEGKRLYGTSLLVNKPESIKGNQKVAIILKAAMYQEEIKRQLLALNPNIEIRE